MVGPLSNNMLNRSEKLMSIPDGKALTSALPPLTAAGKVVNIDRGDGHTASIHHNDMTSGSSGCLGKLSEPRLPGQADANRQSLCGK
jgi:hypothetical protein